MYEVSAAFAAAMENRPYVAKLTLDGNEVIEGNAIQSVIFRGGTNGDQDAFTLGGTVSGSVEILLHKDQVACALQDREIKVELGMELASGTEWVPMGVYFATDPLADDDLLTVTALDALGVKFEREYEPIPGFGFGTDTGVSSTAFLSALCARRGVTVDVSNLATIQLKAPPDGFTERQIIGFIAALYGGFADIDRTGILRIRSYSESGVRVTSDNYYEGGMEKADYDFSVKWLKCYNENTDLTMFVGDLDAEQGIYLESIWMDYTILNDLLDKLQGFSYWPVTELSFLGNPLIDPGDIITMEDLAGETIKIPVMNISHEYDGGILTRVTANGQAKTVGHTNSTQREIRRASASAKKYTDSENEKLNQLELMKRLTKEWVDDAIYLTEDGKIGIKATAILTGILNANLIQTGKIKSADGKVAIDLSGGEVMFFDGISTNGLRVKSDENQNVSLFQVDTRTRDDGTPYTEVTVRDAAGNIHMDIAETFLSSGPSTGMEMRIFSPDQKLEFAIAATNDFIDVKMVNAATGRGKVIFSIEPGNGIRLFGRTPEWEYNSTIGKYILVSE